MSKSSDPDDVRIRPFADFIREQNKGATHEEMSEAIHDLVARVKETGRKGSVVLNITIEPNKKNPDVLLVSDVVVKKLPQPERKASIFYADNDGNLSRTDPGQLTFEGLKQVAEPETAPTKEKKQA